MPVRAAIAILMLRLYGVYAVTVFAFITLSVLFIVAVLPGLARRRRVASAGARLIFLLCGIPIERHGSQRLPSEPCVVVANHASYLDGIILCAILPPRFGFVIKREVTRAPFVHFLLRRIGSHFVERHNRHRGASDTRTLLRAASAGRSLAIFPEGTFHPQAGLRRFRAGAFAAAVAGKLPVVPLSICGSRHLLPAHVWWPRPGRLRLDVHAKIDCVGDGRAEMERLAQAARAVLLTSLDEPDLDPAGAADAVAPAPRPNAI